VVFLVAKESIVTFSRFYRGRCKLIRSEANDMMTRKGVCPRGRAVQSGCAVKAVST
jgi:hypothetical protein